MEMDETARLKCAEELSSNYASPNSSVKTVMCWLELAQDNVGLVKAALEVDSATGGDGFRVIALFMSGFFGGDYGF